LGIVQQCAKAHSEWRLGAPGLFQNTTGATSQFLDDPVQPERSHYFDAGVSQKIPMGCSTLAPLMFTEPPARVSDCGTLEVGLLL
jgi:hypothetical protein